MVMQKREVESTGKQMSKEELERSEKLKQEELRRELQKVKMRRLVSHSAGLVQVLDTCLF